MGLRDTRFRLTATPPSPSEYRVEELTLRRGGQVRVRLSDDLGEIHTIRIAGNHGRQVVQAINTGDFTTNPAMDRLLRFMASNGYLPGDGVVEEDVIPDPAPPVEEPAP